MENFTPTDAIALRNSADYDMGGGWLWLLVILFAMGNNGFGFGNNGVSNLATVDYVSSEFTQRDIAGVNQNVSDTKYDLGMNVLENRFASQLGDANLQNQILSTSCATDKEVLQNRYDNAIQTQVLSSQIATEGCESRATSTANTQKILDKLCSMEVQDLRTQLSAKENQIQELMLENSQQALASGIVNSIRPYPQPSYIVSSPYTSIYNPYNYAYGYNNFA